MAEADEVAQAAAKADTAIREAQHALATSRNKALDAILILHSIDSKQTEPALHAMRRGVIEVEEMMVQYELAATTVANYRRSL